MTVKELVDIFEVHPKLTTRVWVNAKHDAKNYEDCGTSITYAAFLIKLDKHVELTEVDVKSITYNEGSQDGNYILIDLGNIGQLINFFKD